MREHAPPSCPEIERAFAVSTSANEEGCIQLMLPHGRRLASLRLCIEKHSDSYKSACCNAGRHPSFGTGRSQSFMIPSEVDTHTVFADVLCLNRVSFFAWLRRPEMRRAWGMPALWPSHLMCENAEVRLYIYATDPEAEEDEQDTLAGCWLKTSSKTVNKTMLATQPQEQF